MNKFHQQILEEIKKTSKKAQGNAWVASYLGSSSEFFGLNNLQKRNIAKGFIKEHSALTLKEFTETLDSLYQGKSYEEKTVAGFLLEYASKLRVQLDPKKLDFWLDYLSGWAEVDTTCQSNFTAKDILGKWTEWAKLLGQFAKDKNISKKRASLVLLNKAVSQSEEQKIADLAFKNIEVLKAERDILITKAISWVLRSLIKNHKEEVRVYLAKNSATLPKIAVREAKRKLETGKK